VRLGLLRLAHLSLLWGMSDRERPSGSLVGTWLNLHLMRGQEDKKYREPRVRVEGAEAELLRRLIM